MLVVARIAGVVPRCTICWGVDVCVNVRSRNACVPKNFMVMPARHRRGSSRVGVTPRVASMSVTFIIISLLAASNSGGISREAIGVCPEPS